MTDRPAGKPERAGEAIERLLQAWGVKTDTPSLRQEASTGTDPSRRALAIEVLALRGDRESVPLFAAILKSANDRLVQESAALALARLGDPRGVSALKQYMETSSDPSGKLFLASQLAEFGDASGYPLIVQAVTSKKGQERLLAIANLVAFVPFQGRTVAGTTVDPVDRLIALAKDPDPKVREEALTNMPLAVGKGASVATFKPTVERMAASDPDPGVKERAQLTLVLWETPSAPPEAKT